MPGAKILNNGTECLDLFVGKQSKSLERVYYKLEFKNNYRVEILA